MFNSLGELFQSIAKREANIEAQEKELNLMKPLVVHLTQVRLHIARNQEIIPRHVTLFIEDWEDQYKGGINRCVGFDILWSSRNA